MNRSCINCDELLADAGIKQLLRLLHYSTHILPDNRPKHSKFVNIHRGSITAISKSRTFIGPAWLVLDMLSPLGSKGITKVHKYVSVSACTCHEYFCPFANEILEHSNTKGMTVCIIGYYDNHDRQS